MQTEVPASKATKKKNEARLENEFPELGKTPKTRRLISYSMESIPKTHAGSTATPARRYNP
jgi:hypothetical protein